MRLATTALHPGLGLRHTVFESPQRPDPVNWWCRAQRPAVGLRGRTLCPAQPSEPPALAEAE